MMRETGLHLLPLVVAAVLTATSGTRAQSLEERLDEDRFLRGLGDLQLPEVLEHYNAARPAQTGMEEARREIAALRMAALVEADPAARAQAVDALLEARATVLAVQPDDPRRATWQLDQVADRLFLEWPLDACGLATVVGLPTTAQRERARAAARDMLALTGDAEITLEETLLQIEAMPGSLDDPALIALRDRLLRGEGERRLPFLRGVATVLHAEINEVDPAVRRALFEEARARLEPLLDLLDEPLAGRARLYVGLAQARLGEYELADAQFRQVVAEPSSTAVNVFLASMGTVVNQTVRGGPDLGLRGLADVEALYADSDNLLLRLLIADRRVLLQTQLDGERAEPLRVAVDTYRQMLEAADVDAARQLYPAVLGRLTTLIADGATIPRDTPPLVALAVASSRAVDPATRDEAIAGLRELRLRPDLSPMEDAAVLQRLASALYENDAALEAGDLWCTLASSHPTHHDAERAIDRTMHIALSATRADPDDDAAAALLARTIEVLLRQYPSLPATEQALYESGRLAVEVGDLDRAESMFSSVSEDAAWWVDARLMLARLASMRVDAAADAVERRAAQRALSEVARDVRSQLTAARAARPSADPARLDAAIGSVRVLQASALIAVDEPHAALLALENLETAPGVDRQVQAEAVRLRIEALRDTGAADALVEAIDALSATIPETAGHVLATLTARVAADVVAFEEADELDTARDAAAHELLPLTLALHQWMQEHAPDAFEDIDLLRAAADGYRLAGRSDEALRLYDRLLMLKPDVLEAVFGRAECLFMRAEQSDLAEAIVLYRRIALSRSAAEDRFFWTAELRMLQILDQVGRNLHQVQPRINRLRQRDAELGGPTRRRVFERLAEEHGR